MEVFYFSANIDANHTQLCSFNASHTRIIYSVSYFVRLVMRPVALLGWIMIMFCLCRYLLIMACFLFFPFSTEEWEIAVQHSFQRSTIQTRIGIPHWCLWCSCAFFERNCTRMQPRVRGKSMFPTYASITIVQGDCSCRIYIIIIQQIVTLSKYGHDALDICHP